MKRWQSTGSIVARRLGMRPRSEVSPKLLAFLPRAKEWHHSLKDGKMTREDWFSKEDIERAKRRLRKHAKNQPPAA